MSGFSERKSPDIFQLLLDRFNLSRRLPPAIEQLYAA